MWSANWPFTHLSKLHKEQPQLVDNALQHMIENNPDLAWSLVVSAYLDKEINLGKAAEILNLHELELKDRFLELGIALRLGPADKAEAIAEGEAIRAWFEQDDNYTLAE